MCGLRATGTTMARSGFQPPNHGIAQRMALYAGISTGWEAAKVSLLAIGILKYLSAVNLPRAASSKSVGKTTPVRFLVIVLKITQSLLEIPFAIEPQEISIRKPERINVSEIYITKEFHPDLDRGKYQSIR